MIFFFDLQTIETKATTQPLHNIRLFVHLTSAKEYTTKTENVQSQCLICRHPLRLFHFPLLLEALLLRPRENTQISMKENVFWKSDNLHQSLDAPNTTVCFFLCVNLRKLAKKNSQTTRKIAIEN